MKNEEIIKAVKDHFDTYPYDKGLPYRMWCYINTFLPDDEKNGKRTEIILAACV